MALLYADEDVPDDLVVLLRQHGLDIMTVAEAGRAGLGDPVVLADAIANGRAVLTFNRWDFARLHKRQPVHFGIVSCTRDDDTSGLAARILAALQTETPLDGKHVRINR